MVAKIKHGIALYNIEKDGCLNGVYTNEDPLVNGKIFNEIIRRQINSDNSNGVVGVYDCFYFDLENERVDAMLTISPFGNLENTYSFEWVKVGETTPVFVGIGYQMNPRQIAVHYYSA